MIWFLCTGNAARSVMGHAAWAQRRPDVEVGSAGTLAIEWMPMSRRTSAALARHGLSLPGHRSEQLGPQHVDKAALVVAMAAEHVAWVRRELPELASRTALLAWLALSADWSVTDVAEWGLATLAPDVAPDVIDPAGGEQDLYDAVADEVVELTYRIADAAPGELLAVTAEL